MHSQLVRKQVQSLQPIGLPYGLDIMQLPVWMGDLLMCVGCVYGCACVACVACAGELSLVCLQASMPAPSSRQSSQLMASVRWCTSVLSVPLAFFIIFRSIYHYLAKLFNLLTMLIIFFCLPVPLSLQQNLHFTKRGILFCLFVCLLKKPSTESYCWAYSRQSLNIRWINEWIGALVHVFMHENI